MLVISRSRLAASLCMCVHAYKPRNAFQCCQRQQSCLNLFLAPTGHPAVWQLWWRRPADTSPSVSCKLEAAIPLKSSSCQPATQEAPSCSKPVAPGPAPRTHHHHRPHIPEHTHTHTRAFCRCHLCAMPAKLMICCAHRSHRWACRRWQPPTWEGSERGYLPGHPGCGLVEKCGLRFQSRPHRRSTI